MGVTTVILIHKIEMKTTKSNQNTETNPINKIQTLITNFESKLDKTTLTDQSPKLLRPSHSETNNKNVLTNEKRGGGIPN